MMQPSGSASAQETKETQVGSVFVSNYPPYSAWKPESVPSAREALERRGDPSTPMGLYLHIPFCRIRCRFCYFKVYEDKDSAQVKAYLGALAREAEIFARQPAVAGRPLRYVYFGGGTPSFISTTDLKALCSRVQAALPWSGAEEISFECEPGTLTAAKVAAIRAIGVTRLSLGIENFDDAVLEANGRAHLSAEIDRCLPWIRAAGFPQLNVDLIAGMVGETWDKWKATIARTLALAADSVTIYQMEVPHNTILSEDLKGGSTPPVAGWDLKREWQQYAFDELARAGYVLSSAYTMVRPGGGSSFVYRDCNWRGGDMLGTGVASFSHVNGVLFQNLPDWGPYMERLAAGQLPIGRAFAGDPADRMRRELILQMKLGRLDTGYFSRKFGVEILSEFAPAFAKLERAGMMTLDAGGVSLTREGLMRVDHLLPELYAPIYQGARYT